MLRHRHQSSSSSSSSSRLPRCSSSRPRRPRRPPRPPLPATDNRLTDVSTAAPPQDTGRKQLEDAYQQRSAAPSPAPPPPQQQAAGQQQQQQRQQQHQRQQSPQPAAQQQAASLLQARARALFISRVLPVLRLVRAAERKLGAPFARVANSVLLMVAIICYDLGVNNVLDRLLGESPAGSVSCVFVGLGMVVGVKLSGSKVLDFWEV